MWCDTNAWRPLARQNVFFSSAPQASTGRGSGPAQRQRLRHVPAGAAQHRLRGRGTAAPPSRRCGCGSAGRGSGTRPRCRRSRAQRVVVAVGDRLVGDVAAGQHDRLADVAAAAGGAAACTAASARARRLPGATDVAPPARPRLRGSSTIGRRRLGQQPPPRPRRPRTASRGLVQVGHHDRERLVLAVLALAAASPAAASSPASTARW